MEVEVSDHMRKATDHDKRTTLRTRAHIIADLSVHHVEGIVLRKGYTVELFRRDYGYDFDLFTYDYSGGQDGTFEPESIKLQLKATDNLTVLQDGKTIAFAGIRRAHINLWTRALMPVYLIIYDVVADVAYWLDVQAHAASGAFVMGRSQQTVTVRLPIANVLDGNAIEMFRLTRLRRYAILKKRKREN